MEKAWISLLALVLAIAYPFTALAATWDNVNTAEKLKEAFADTDAAGAKRTMKPCGWTTRCMSR